MVLAAKDLLQECRLYHAVHPTLLAEVGRRNLTPPWAKHFDHEREDWLASLHHAVTDEGWDVLESATAGLIPHGQFLGAAEAAKAIVIPISTPVYLHTLLDLLSRPMVPPDTADPEANMLWASARAQEAMREFKFLMGMLAETNYLDAPQMGDAWLPAVTAGTRFIYYHELGHVVHAQVQDHQLPSWLNQREAEDPDLPFEMVADQFGLSMILLELRHHRELLIPGIAGVVLALGLVVMKAYVELDGPPPGYAVMRMNRLFDWAEKAKRLNSCTEEALTASKHLWSTLYTYFREMHGNHLPSPIFALLRQTSQQPRSAWPTASGHVLQWCTFGDQNRVLRTLRSIRGQALARPNDERAKGVLAVINFLVDDLRDVDHVLGLREALH